MERIVGVYHDGKVEVLGEHHLEEGQQVEIKVPHTLSPAEIRAALATITVAYEPEADLDLAVDEAAIQAQLDAQVQLDEPLSATIIRMRREGL